MNPSPVNPTSPSPEAAWAPAPTSHTPTPGEPASPATPSKLSPLATPYFPASVGRTKIQRWLGSPISDQESPISYKDALCGGNEVKRGTTPRARAASPWPQQLPRIRLRSEIHRVKDAAPDEEGWRVVRSRKSRRQEASRHRARAEILAAILGRCFNCLEKGHLKASCREPMRCLRCGRPGHRSFECRRPRRNKPTMLTRRLADAVEQSHAVPGRSNVLE